MTPISIPLTAPYTRDFALDAPAEIKALSEQVLNLLVQRLDVFAPPAGGTSAGVEVTTAAPGTYRVTISPMAGPFTGTLTITDVPASPE